MVEEAYGLKFNRAEAMETMKAPGILGHIILQYIYIYEIIESYCI